MGVELTERMEKMNQNNNNKENTLTPENEIDLLPPKTSFSSPEYKLIRSSTRSPFNEIKIESNPTRRKLDIPFKTTNNNNKLTQKIECVKQDQHGRGPLAQKMQVSNKTTAAVEPAGDAVPQI